MLHCTTATRIKAKGKTKRKRNGMNGGEAREEKGNKFKILRFYTQKFGILLLLLLLFNHIICMNEWKMHKKWKEKKEFQIILNRTKYLTPLKHVSWWDWIWWTFDKWNEDFPMEWNRCLHDNDTSITNEYHISLNRCGRSFDSVYQRHGSVKWRDSHV